MDMLEKAARAACVADGHNPDGPTCDIYIHDDPDAGKPWASYRNVARAVLLAIREPDEAMVRSFTHSNVSGFNVRNGSICATPHNAAAAWQRMIDAILTTNATSSDSEPQQ